MTVKCQNVCYQNQTMTTKHSPEITNAQNSRKITQNSTQNKQKLPILG